MNLISDSFVNGGEIPKDFSCEGRDISPGLSWSGAPAATRAFALICEDPDVPIGTFTHWVLYDIPPTATRLPQGLPAEEDVPGIGRQGQNSFLTVGYRGPCPPTGPFHRYYFRLYALDTMLVLEPRISRRRLLKAIEGHVLAVAELMGRYEKVPLATFARAALKR